MAREHTSDEAKSFSNGKLMRQKAEREEGVRRGIHCSGLVGARTSRVSSEPRAYFVGPGVLFYLVSQSGEPFTREK